MTTNVYVLNGNQQFGPYGPEDLKAFLKKGQISPTLLSRFDGCADWVPVYCIPEIKEDPSLVQIIKSATSGDWAVEFTVVEATLKELEQLVERLAQRDSTENAALQRAIHRKLQILWRQLYTFKAQFPEATESRMIEASYYRVLALSKFNAVGYLRQESQYASNMIWEVFTDVLAHRQERANALEALSLLDKAVTIFDNPGDRLRMAVIYRLLGQRNEALRELTYLLSNWRPTDILVEYLEARQLRDDLETA